MAKKNISLREAIKNIGPGTKMNVFCGSRKWNGDYFDLLIDIEDKFLQQPVYDINCKKFPGKRHYKIDIFAVEPEIA